MTITQLLDNYSDTIKMSVERLKDEASRVRKVQDKRTGKLYYDAKIQAYNEVIDLLNKIRG